MINTIKAPYSDQKEFMNGIKSFASIDANPNRGDTIIGMLKLLTIAKYKAKIEEYRQKWFWSTYANTMKHLITYEAKNVQSFNAVITSINTNKVVAEELLE